MESWLAGHWFDLVQSAGILAVGLFNLAEYHEARNARRISHLAKLIQNHRDIWREYANNPQLWRIKRSDVDLDVNPITTEEDTFVRLVISHLYGAYESIRAGQIAGLENAAKDAAEFLAYSIPREVWANIRHLQDAGFIAFVEPLGFGDSGISRDRKRM